MSLALTPAGSRPSTLTAIVLNGRSGSVCVASTCSTSDVPMPIAMRTERAVGGGVAVAADDRHAGLGQTELRSDDVHDALFEVAHRMQPDAELVAVASQRLDLSARDRDRRSACRCRPSARCGPRWRSSSPVAGRRGPQAAARRTPAGWSPRARGAGRCRSDRVPGRRRCRRRGRRRGRPIPSPPSCVAALSVVILDYLTIWNASISL